MHIVTGFKEQNLPSSIFADRQCDKLLKVCYKVCFLPFCLQDDRDWGVVEAKVKTSIYYLTWLLMVKERRPVWGIAKLLFPHRSFTSSARTPFCAGTKVFGCQVEMACLLVFKCQFKTRDKVLHFDPCVWGGREAFRLSVDHHEWQWHTVCLALFSICQIYFLPFFQGPQGIVDTVIFILLLLQ